MCVQASVLGVLISLALVGCTLVTEWEQDSETETGEVRRVNPRVTSCLPKSVYDEYPILAIAYGPINEWRLDGSSVTILLPVLAAAHSAANENRKVTVRILRIDSLLHGDRQSRSVCSKAVKQTCFWPWSAMASVAVAETVHPDGQTEQSNLIKLTRYLERDDVYEHAHADLFRYFRQPAAAIHTVCDTQPSTLRRYAALFNVSQAVVEAHLCVYVSLYTVKYSVHERKSDASVKVRRSSLNRRETQSVWRQSYVQLNASESGEPCGPTNGSPRRAFSDSGHKTYRFLLRVDTLLVSSDWPLPLPTTSREAPSHQRFLTDEFFSVEQRGSANSTDDVTTMGSTCRPFGCRLHDSQSCLRKLVFADSQLSAADRAGSAPSFLWTDVSLDFDTGKWITTTTTAMTQAPAVTTGPGAIAAAVYPSNAASGHASLLVRLAFALTMAHCARTIVCTSD